MIIRLDPALYRGALDGAKMRTSCCEGWVGKVVWSPSSALNDLSQGPNMKVLIGFSLQRAAPDLAAAARPPFARSVWRKRERDRECPPPFYSFPPSSGRRRRSLSTESQKKEEKNCTLRECRAGSIGMHNHGSRHPDRDDFRIRSLSLSLVNTKYIVDG